MRRFIGSWSGGVGVALALVACDGAGEAGDAAGRGGSALSPAAAAHVVEVPSLDRPALERPRVAVTRVVPGVPLLPEAPEVPGDNVTCEAARPLGESGARDVVTTGGGTGSGCFSHSLTTRFFRVSVGPREVVDVRLTHARPELHLTWLGAAPGCDAAGDQCAAGWTYTGQGVAIANEGDQPATWIVTAVRLDGARTQRFDLELTRTPLAAHTRCEDARPMTIGRLTDQTLEGAGLGGPNDYLRRVVYYRVEVPAHARVSARVEPMGQVIAIVAPGCAFDAANVTNEATNLEDAPRLFTVAVGTLWDTDLDPFTLVVETTDIAPEAACDAPVRVIEGASVTVDTEQGGAGPGQCWCILPTRAVFAEVVVPAGATVDLVATVLGDTTTGARVDLIGLDAACATECGSDAAFGFDGGATLALDNPGDAAVTRHVLVSGQAGWGGDTRAPEVELAVRPHAR